LVEALSGLIDRAILYIFSIKIRISFMKNILIVVVLGISLGACANARDERMGQGALIGGAGGAIIGGVASGMPGGALVGGVAGAAVGALAADVTRPRRAHRCYYSEYYQRRICRSRN
jgi:hypothetical protein